MRVLLSAFSCGPHMGSEEGVGWNWALEVARLGHHVTVLTETTHQAAIETERRRGALPDGLSFAFFMPATVARLRAVVRRLAGESLSEHVAHLAWQFLALPHVRRRWPELPFDVVHHITYGGIRHPTLLGRLPVPLVLGPLGGGERAPMALRRSFPWRGWMRDLIRDLHTFSLRLDPITRRACADALVVYVKTEESRRALPRRSRGKAAVRWELGIRDLEPSAHRERAPGEPLRLLYAGRFLYWKGMHLGLEALARARAAGADIRLTLLGRGPDEAAWRRLAAELDLERAIDWVPWVAHERMGDVYAGHDALLFPSLHDSSGNAVLESLAHGLPVICLDLGGPGGIVDANSGRIVPTAGRREAEVVQGLADAILELALSPGLCAGLSAGARARARAFCWPDQVRRVYDDIAARLRREATEQAGIAVEAPMVGRPRA